MGIQETQSLHGSLKRGQAQLGLGAWGGPKSCPEEREEGRSMGGPVRERLFCGTGQDAAATGRGGRGRFPVLGEELPGLRAGSLSPRSRQSQQICSQYHRLTPRSGKCAPLHGTQDSNSGPLGCGHWTPAKVSYCSSRSKAPERICSAAAFQGKCPVLPERCSLFGVWGHTRVCSGAPPGSAFRGHSGWRHRTPVSACKPSPYLSPYYPSSPGE